MSLVFFEAASRCQIRDETRSDGFDVEGANTGSATSRDTHVPRRGVRVEQGRSPDGHSDSMQ